MQSVLKRFLSTEAPTTKERLPSKYAWFFNIVFSEIIIFGGTYLSLLELRKNEEARLKLHKYWPSALKRFYWAEDNCPAAKSKSSRRKTTFTRASELLFLKYYEFWQMVRQSSFYYMIAGNLIVIAVFADRALTRRYFGKKMEPMALPSWNAFVKTELKEGRELTMPISDDEKSIN
ncbi:hypothetical protein niasHS_004081 [Heterodera schachtii]|uniref:Uncharacterized protein n=2 Tax=Heterodera TaxID=34509 RepID=A0ABD2JUJ8_HETSC